LIILRKYADKVQTVTVLNPILPAHVIFRELSGILNLPVSQQQIGFQRRYARFMKPLQTSVALEHPQLPAVETKNAC
jgi:hypothetical protein